MNLVWGSDVGLFITDQITYNKKILVHIKCRVSQNQIISLQKIEAFRCPNAISHISYKVMDLVAIVLGMTNQYLGAFQAAGSI